MASFGKVLALAFFHLVISGVRCTCCLWLQLVPPVGLYAFVSTPGRSALFWQDLCADGCGIAWLLGAYGTQKDPIPDAPMILFSLVIHLWTVIAEKVEISPPYPQVKALLGHQLSPGGLCTGMAMLCADGSECGMLPGAYGDQKKVFSY